MTGGTRTPPHQRSVVALAAPIAVAAVLAGGGCGVVSPDLFVLQRTGSIPGARLTLLVNDGGTVRCDGGPARPLPDPDLLKARALQSDLATDAKHAVRLAPGPGSVLSYRYRAPQGSVAFSDTSPGVRPEMDRLAAFARTVARDVCGRPR